MGYGSIDLCAHGRSLHLSVFTAAPREESRLDDETFAEAYPTARWGRVWFQRKPELRINEEETKRGDFRLGAIDVALRWLCYGVAFSYHPKKPPGKEAYA